MTNEIAEIFQQAVNRTNLIERYDGVVRRVTDKGETFPVSCTDPTACDNGRYRKAIPDESLRGLAYVEQRGNGTTGPIESWGYSITFPVRLVMWINIGKQSIDNCSNITSQAYFNIVNCLNLQKSITVDYSTKAIKAKVSGFQMVNKSAGEIFQGLAYQDKAKLYVYPFDYLVIDCSITFQIPANCIAAIAPTVAADCY